MIGALRAVAIDARDARGLAGFYMALRGWRELYAEDDFIAMATGEDWRVAVQESPDHVAPRWPDPARPQQAHLDLRVADLDAATAGALRLGAVLLRRNESWHTLADPAGHPFDLCLSAERAAGVTIDCPDAGRLSAFYTGLLGEDGARPLRFQQVDGYQAPRWPDPAYPQQLHLDVTVQDVDAAEAAVFRLGATSLHADGENWRVYADPAGKPFCLCWD